MDFTDASNQVKTVGLENDLEQNGGEHKTVVGLISFLTGGHKVLAQINNSEYAG